MTDPSVGAATGGAGRRVLVVDDEEDIRDLVMIWLRDDPRCAAVAEASDVDSAVRAVQAQSFDAVLLDFSLGSRTCVEILPELRRALPDALIVVYTASRRAATDAGVIPAGADLVLEKATVSIDDVVETVLTATPEASRAS